MANSPAFLPFNQQFCQFPEEYVCSSMPESSGLSLQKKIDMDENGSITGI
jgi:hypothetical protein